MSVGETFDVRLSQMKTFLAVCEYRSFTAAAQSLYTSQSCVSKSMASLERLLGFPLFVRGAGEIDATPAAKILEQKWRQSIDSIESAVEDASRVSAGGAPIAKIGLSDSMRKDMPYEGLIAGFISQFPDIRFTFLEYPTGSLVPRLINGQLDGIFTVDYEVDRLEAGGQRWAFVEDSPYLQVCVPVRSSLASHDELTAEDLKDAEFIKLDPIDNKPYNDMVEQLCLAAGFEANFGAIAPNARSAISTMLRTGEGVLLGNAYIYDGEDPRIKRVPIKGTLSRLIFGYHAGDERASRFAHMLEQNYSASG